MPRTEAGRALIERLGWFASEKGDALREGILAVEQEAAVGLADSTFPPANPPRTEQPERFALRYSGQHDDCIATVPHYHDRPYQLGDWAAAPVEPEP